jgi:dynein intermediate chain
VCWVAIYDIASELTCDAPIELTEEERASIIAAPEFLEFVENSSKIVQRALNDGYDYIRDYTLNADSGG